MFCCFVIFSVFWVNLVSADLGDGLWRTFEHQTALPLSAASAEEQSWVKVSECDNNLGVLFARDDNGPSEKHPLGLRFTSSGLLAGVQTTIYGSNKQGPAAPDNLVKLGFWKKTNATETWVMDVSFRAPSEMCSSSSSANLIGDRVVINQDTIKYSIPLTVEEAVKNSWTSGSCMSSMG
jgi:hypothetical protein